MCAIPSDDHIGLEFVLFQIQQLLFFFQDLTGNGAASEKVGNPPTGYLGYVAGRYGHIRLGGSGRPSVTSKATLCAALRDVVINLAVGHDKQREKDNKKLASPCFII